MKTPPSNPEFAVFTSAMRGIMKVSKVELQARIDAEKRGKQAPKAPSSRVSASRAKPA
jgi:hypothetical protein